MARYFTKDHEWIDASGQVVTIGITDHAQGQLGDIVFVELPEIGRAVSTGDDVAVVESVKAASDVYSPVDGTVTEANEAIVDNPAMVNESPEGDGWFFKVEVAGELNAAEWMDAEAYKAFLATLD